MCKTNIKYTRSQPVLTFMNQVLVRVIIKYKNIIDVKWWMMKGNNLNQGYSKHISAKAKNREMFPYINVALLQCSPFTVGFPLLVFSTIMQYSSFCHFNAFFYFPFSGFFAITISPQPISQNNCLTIFFGFFAITISPQPISDNNCLTFSF